METIRFLELEDILYFFKEEMAIAGTKGWIRDQFELDACVESPKHSFDGNYLFDVYGMAAKYVASFSIRHPFSDGNKRIAAISSVVFLEVNGYNYLEEYEGHLAEIIFSYLKGETNDEDLRRHFQDRCEIPGAG